LTGVTGDLEEAVRAASKVLNIRGRVLPASLENVVLCAEYEDGSIVEGESQIPLARRRIRRVFLKPDGVAALPEALEAIGEADLILIGPGSLYTSVIPNLLVRGVADAVRRAAAPRIYICNVMTQPGETDGFTAADHLRAIVTAAGPGPGLITHALVNVQAPTNVALSRRYEAEGAFPVAADLAELRRLVPEVITGTLISEQELLRHDPETLAAAVMRAAATSTNRKVKA
ncbi:MAG: YvcK family protein, partial [Armatimonadetes bacterium]|nr:YvcK family protein [Armatimonadota bacterium]